MSPEQIEQFRAALLSLREELEGLDAGAQADAQPVELDQASVGRLSRMDAIQQQQMAKDTARRRQAQLARIAGALRRIEADDYGWCAACGEAIDARRLQIDPTCTRCIACAD